MGSLEPRTTEGVTLLIPLCQRSSAVVENAIPDWHFKIGYNNNTKPNKQTK